MGMVGIEPTSYIRHSSIELHPQRTFLTVSAIAGIHLCANRILSLRVFSVNAG